MKCKFWNDENKSCEKASIKGYNACKGDKKECLPDKSISVTLSGGLVSEVYNLPPGWDYETVEVDKCGELIDDLS